MSFKNGHMHTLSNTRQLLSALQRMPRLRWRSRTCWWASLILIASFGLGLNPVGVAQEASPEYDASEVLFARRIEPLFREKCMGCHGQDVESIEGGLDVRSLESLTAGGESGEAGIVPGEPEASSIYLAAMRAEDDFSAMPPKESEALNDEQLEWLRDWIESGAKWPSEARTGEIKRQYADAWSVEDGVIVKTSGGLDASWTNRRYDPAGLWAYRAVKSVRPGELADGDHAIKGPEAIDQLIQDAMPAGMTPTPRADRQTLIRRATFDLTGLPPSPGEVTAFVNDPADDQAAFAALVDRLLDSPHYGERMAQHWLDVTRYADSSGFANDFERGNAWRYRDYVIRSFNNDKPYDQFICEQIAGDEIAPHDPEGIIATGFLRMGPWELTGMEVAKVARMRFLDDVTNSVGETFLGQSLQCCRCHDHKFDPIPTQDYYSFQAVFATTQLVEQPAKFLKEENQTGFDELRYLKQQKANYEQTMEELDELILKNAEDWFEEAGMRSAKNETGTKQPSANRSTILAQWNAAVAEARKDKPAGGVFKAARSAMMRAGVKQADLPPVKVGFTPQQFGLERVARKGLMRLTWEFDRYKPFAHSVYNGHTPKMTNVSSPLRLPKDPTKGELEASVIHTGGDPFAQGDSVVPGVLSVIADQLPADIPQTLGGRRKALAKWIANAQNPLTTRVIANRVWQWHFGRALAGNPNNFGSTGKRPTHPELLDWLAGELVAGDWSIKRLHRQIMNSDTYCRSSQYPQEHGAAVPPDRDALANARTWYAVFMPRRLSAEELRDSMLSVSDELNPTLGGIPCRPIINSEVALQPRQVMGTFAAAWTPNPKPEQRNRRSIYVLKLRGLVDPSLEVFNAPSPDFSCERRDTSTVTPQVFAMFNSNSAHARALGLAHRVTQETHDSAEAIRRIYTRLFGRMASDEEIARCLSHWEHIESLLPAEADSSQLPKREVVREAVEENTGEKFTFIETLFAMDDFVPDTQANDVSRRTRALADVCLVLMNSNEFIYIY